MQAKHWNIKLAKAPERQPLMAGLLYKKYIQELQWLQDKKVLLLSPKTILRFIDEELIHDNDAILKQSGQFLHSMSSGLSERAYCR